MVVVCVRLFAQGKFQVQIVSGSGHVIEVSPLRMFGFCPVKLYLLELCSSITGTTV